MISLPFRITLPRQLVNGVRSVWLHILPVNFITLHYLYFITLSMIAAIIFWASSTPEHSISFTDSLFLSVSTMTQAGLNTVNLSEVNTWQQVLLFIQMLLGSSILVSCAVVNMRKRAFETRFASVIDKKRTRRRALKSNISHPSPHVLGREKTDTSTSRQPEVDGRIVRGRAIPPNANDEKLFEDQDNPGNRPRAERMGEGDLVASAISNAENAGSSQGSEDAAVCSEYTGADTSSTPNEGSHVRFAEMHRRPMRSTIIHMSGVGARQDLENYPRFAHPRSAHTKESASVSHYTKDSLSGNLPSTSKYFESDGFVGRNSQFHSLSFSERERLGGVEYKALVLLEVIVALYYLLWHLLGCVALAAWVAHYESDTALANGVNPWWVGAFLGASAFNNNGMSLLDANMVAFQSSYYVLITVGLLILAGNTCYPVFLRFILWTLYRLLPNKSWFSDYKTTLRFLLDHPRRCYTTLFPSNHTWWLFGSIVALNCIDWIAFEILNINNEAIFTSPDASRALDGLFQALAVRSGGFYVVPIANLRIGLLVLYVLMMYISVYPVTITIRNSNVYEERSLGIYADDPGVAAENEKPSKLPAFLANIHRPTKEGSRGYFVRQQLRGQLAHDLWWLCLAILLITIIETQQFGSDPVTFAVFNIVFETVSAYGCVGISTGAPGVAFSFSGKWHVLSKLILCAVMLRGRHRGLPVAIDRAVLLPGEHLGAAEEEDAIARRERTVERHATRRQTVRLAHGGGALTV